VLISIMPGIKEPSGTGGRVEARGGQEEIAGRFEMKASHKKGGDAESVAALLGSVYNLS
jgi:hypothetical protein